MKMNAVDHEAMWELFKETGNIIFYLLYKELPEEEDTEKTA